MKKIHWGVVLAGVAVGLAALILTAMGNPANMGFCIACFLRDTAGACGLHSAAKVQYVRPEIIGLVLGAFLMSVAGKEFKARAGSSPALRFVIGAFVVIGALAFLGCPLRMVLRMAAGDLNAYVALIGFVAGVFTGTLALKRGFSLGRAYTVDKASGTILPIAMVVLFVLSLTTTLFVSSEKGPGSMHAPVFIALIGGLLFGAIAQKCRSCFAGCVRDIILMKNFDLLTIVGGIFVVMVIYNIATGNFNLSFTGQPVAHAQHIWNILGMYAVGFAAVLAGGCPLRQLVLAGQGSSDSAVTFLGLFVGAAFCHNFGLAGVAAAAATADAPAVAGGPGINGQVAVIACIVILFIIGFMPKNKKN